LDEASDSVVDSGHIELIDSGGNCQGDPESWDGLVHQETEASTSCFEC
jgi:hypothetical protein